jgi:hypothetical protein
LRVQRNSTLILSFCTLKVDALNIFSASTIYEKVKKLFAEENLRISQMPSLSPFKKG